MAKCQVPSAQCPVLSASAQQYEAPSSSSSSTAKHSLTFASQ
eukprot:gene14834-10608_t